MRLLDQKKPSIDYSLDVQEGGVLSLRRGGSWPGGGGPRALGGGGPGQEGGGPRPKKDFNFFFSILKFFNFVFSLLGLS